ncbi:MAG: hypothetical protein J7L25_01930, partial [Deltaproteobacteria bacterium]|nr:hypothetical protein [Candidatus Tharpella aukensis]
DQQPQNMAKKTELNGFLELELCNSNLNFIKSCLGGCPRIGFFLRSRHFLTISTGIHLVFRALFSKNNAELGKKDVLGQPPRGGPSGRSSRFSY